MNRFPMTVDLRGRVVLLVGSGPEIDQKAEKLAPFGASLVKCRDVTGELLEQDPVLVIVGDTEPEKARQIYDLCRKRRIPVNVVDMPRLCTFYFPALITRGDLTISVSTGGASPAAASYLRQQIEAQLPDRTEEILQWLHGNRQELRRRGILKAAVAAAFSLRRPLTGQELDGLQEEG